MPALPAARAAFIQIIGEPTNKVRIITQMAEREVASVTKQSAVFAGFMAMVDVEPSTSVISTAGITLRSRLNLSRLIFGQAIFAYQPRRMMNRVCSSVVFALGGPALCAMLGTILTHARVLTFSAAIFSLLPRHIFKSKVLDFERLATHAARSFCHNIIVTSAPHHAN